ncbi:transmembrane protease serine 12-like isoform X2 [Macrotis lagotis]|uniref:transmembrane protease serine 12-like isoform X2 n=1 Tax=Macrotis lagotis TaxID=92651 RepID=UPI003D6941B7
MKSPILQMKRLRGPGRVTHSGASSSGRSWPRAPIPSLHCPKVNCCLCGCGPSPVLRCLVLRPIVKVGIRRIMGLRFLGIALWLAGEAFTSYCDQVSLFKKCGRVPLKNEIQESRIIGGHMVQSGSWPWIVSLQVMIFADQFTHFCGGSLIKKKWIMTAAHCLENYRNPQHWRAVVGVNDLFQSPQTSRKIQVDTIIIHPFFIPGSYVNDIALVRLKKAVNYNKYIQPICLPFFDFLPNLTRATRCFISGWGQTRRKGQYSSILQEAEVHYIPRNICNSEESYDETVPYTSFCAGEEDGTVDTCMKPGGMGIQGSLEVFV